jgi:hypothetical protein
MVRETCSQVAGKACDSSWSAAIRLSPVRKRCRYDRGWRRDTIAERYANLLDALLATVPTHHVAVRVS